MDDTMKSKRYWYWYNYRTEQMEARLFSEHFSDEDARAYIPQYAAAWSLYQYARLMGKSAVEAMQEVHEAIAREHNE